MSLLWVAGATIDGCCCGHFCSVLGGSSSGKTQLFTDGTNGLLENFFVCCCCSSFLLLVMVNVKAVIV